MDKEIIKTGNKIEQVDDLFEGIDLPEDTADVILLEALGESIVENIPVIGKVANFFQSAQEKLDQAKLMILLKGFRHKHDSNEEFQNAFKKLIGTPAGMALIQKVVRIANAGIIDQRYIGLLANVLKNISDSDFKEMFDEYNYTLSQIEKLTPQALILLSDHSNWPGISFSSTTTSGVTSGSGWDESFATLYSNRKGKPDQKTRNRISHSINEIMNNHLIDLKADNLPLTSIGNEILKALS